MPINRYEIASQIYDTLMQNVDFAQFDTDLVEAQELDAQNGRISFEYQGTRVYIEIITEDVTLA